MAPEKKTAASTCEEISEKLAQQLYGKSTSLDAPENQNSDFRSGYAVGLTATPKTRDKEWNEAWREYGSPLVGSPQWVNWKRGFHAGRFAAISAEHREQQR